MDCNNCLNTYNKEDRRPRSIPCGHTFCTACIGEIKTQSQFICPVCNKTFAADEDVLQFPVNDNMEELLTIMTAKQKSEKIEKTSVRSLQSRVEEEKANIKQVLTLCSQKKSNMQQYHDLVNSWIIEHQQMRDTLTTLMHKNNQALKRLQEELANLLHVTKEAELSRIPLEQQLEQLNSITTTRQANSVIDIAGRCRQYVKSWCSFSEQFPDCETVFQAAMLRERVKDVLEKLKVEEKAAEMIMPDLPSSCSSLLTKADHLIKEARAGSIKARAGSIEARVDSIEAGAGSTEATAGSTEAGAGSTEAGADSTDATAGSTEATAGSTEAGTGSTEAGAGSTEATAGSTEATAGSTEAGAGSTEATTGSTEAGAGSTEATAGSAGAGSTEATAGSTEAGAGSTETTAGSTEAGAGSTETTDGSIDVDSLYCMGEKVRKMIEAGRLYAFHNRSSAITLDNDRLCLHALGPQPPPPGASNITFEEAVRKVDPTNKEVFLDLAWGGTTRGRVHITLSRDTPAGRQFVLLCTGQRGPSFKNTNFFRVYDRGGSNERVYGGDYEYNNGTGGAALAENVIRARGKIFKILRKNFQAPAAQSPRQ